jgi:hypothetical protein
MVRTITTAIATSLTSNSAVPTTAALPLDEPTAAEAATDVGEGMDPKSTTTIASTPAFRAAPDPPRTVPADSAPATTLPTSVEPPSSSDPATTTLTTVPPSPEPAPVATQPPTTSPPPETTPPTDPPTTSPPTTVDHATLCAQLESRKQAIEAEIKRVEQAYANDPATRDRLKAQLEAEKNAVEQQRKAAHC